MDRLHFGVVRREYTGDPATFIGHSDPTYELGFEIELAVSGIELQGWVSGSWECWGPADQSTDGGPSLHVVVEVDPVYAHWAQQDMTTFHQELWTKLSGRCGFFSRLIDHAVITGKDWADVTGIIMFGSRPFVVGYATGARLL